MAELDLSHYSTAPLFNTKAVVQETGVTAATLRAWERRYGVPEPDRTGSNYRLYSERDIALIRWLRERVDSGISISQAVELYRRASAGQDMPTTLLGASPRREVGQPHDMPSSRTRLIEAFKSFDERQADLLLNQLFALYPIEDVLTEILQPVMIEVGEQWHSGVVSVPVEHFSTAYVERKVMALINAQPYHADAPLVITGCAPHEQHELGVLLLSFFLRRNGLRVVYLGQNVPAVDLRAVLETLRPAMLALSAMTEESAAALQPIGEMIAHLPVPRPLFAVGGGAFFQSPHLLEMLHAVSLGNDAQHAADEALRHIRRPSSG